MIRSNSLLSYSQEGLEEGLEEGRRELCVSRYQPKVELQLLFLLPQNLCCRSLLGVFCAVCRPATTPLASPCQYCHLSVNYQPKMTVSGQFRRLRVK